MTKVLVCEDEASIRSFVVLNLRRVGYEVLEADSGEEALRLAAAHPDVTVALLDVMLPGIDGFETCRCLREQSSAMGIIMLTARTQETEKVSALRMGADDYVTKPFGIAELLARVAALTRRVETDTSAGVLETLTSGEFTLQLRQRQLYKQDVPVELTQVEYQLMEYFFQHPKEPLDRLAILHQVWGKEYCGDDKVVDVNIRRLRMKIEDDPSAPRHIATVWGMGYQWNG